MQWSRRDFLAHSLALSVAGANRLQADPASTQGVIRTIPFVEEGDGATGVLLPGSHKGRLVVDLSRLSAATRITPNDGFFVRTRYPDLFTAPERWRIAIAGEVERSGRLALDELEGLVKPMGVQLLECSGNSKFRNFGLLSSAHWSGIPMEDVVGMCRERFGIRPGATRVMVEGVDEHSDFATKRVQGASWIFGLDQLRETGAYLATRMNGEPLPKDHGAPIRLIVPNWYGCSNIKWVRSINFVTDDARSTPQMREFAGRTHQDGVPELARDFRAASMDFSAMVTRVEMVSDERGVHYRLSGATWGGEQRVSRLEIRFQQDGDSETVDNFEHDQPQGFSFWEHRWHPKQRGRYGIALSVPDPTIPTIRLDKGRYVRHVDLAEV